MKEKQLYLAPQCEMIFLRQEGVIPRINIQEQSLSLHRIHS